MIFLIQVFFVLQCLYQNSMEKIVWAMLQQFIIPKKSFTFFRYRYFPRPLSTYLDSVMYGYNGKCSWNRRWGRKSFDTVALEYSIKSWESKRTTNGIQNKILFQLKIFFHHGEKFIQTFWHFDFQNFEISKFSPKPKMFIENQYNKIEKIDFFSRNFLYF